MIIRAALEPDGWTMDKFAGAIYDDGTHILTIYLKHIGSISKEIPIGTADDIQKNLAICLDKGSSVFNFYDKWKLHKKII